MASAITSLPATPASSARERVPRSLVDLCTGYGLILVVIWTPRPWQRLLYVGAAAYLIFLLWRSFEGWAEMGLRLANLGRSAWVLGVATVMAGGAVAIAARMHTLNWPGGILPFARRYLGYAIWSVFQQILLQGLFLKRLLQLTRRPWVAALSAAVLFSVAHLPNPILTATTLVWGLSACLIFLRYRNLYPLALAHAIFGITLAMTVPGTITHNMRVGLGYVAYGLHHGYAPGH